MLGIIGKKVGMTSFFDSNTGKYLACTLLEVGPCVVTQVRTLKTDGYEALQMAFEDKKEKAVNASERGHFAKAGVAVKRYVKEFRNCSLEKELGAEVLCTIFQEGDKVDVVGRSKGRGFQGVVKRHGFRGVGEASHGQHDRQRAPGSVGGSSFPSRVFKGLRMAGRMGGNSVKIKGLEVLKVLPERHCLVVAGAVPGCNGSLVFVQK